MSNNPYVRLAKQSITYFFKHNHFLPTPTDLPNDMLRKRHGTFVSLHKNGRLRGCIGTIHPTTSCVANEIIHNAVSAATRDWRFQAVTADEIDDLELSVDVLMPPERIHALDQLDIKRYGVIVRSGFKSGLLLPNLEGIKSVEEQVDIAKRKAGISQTATVELERFEVIRYT